MTPYITTGSLPLRVTVMVLAWAAWPGSAVTAQVSEKILKRPPYVAGKPMAAGARVRHVTIHYQTDGSDLLPFVPDGGPGTPVAALVLAMNGYLDSLLDAAPLDAVTREPAGGPDVFFGCATDAAGDCIEWDDDTRVQRGTELLLKADLAPSRAWRDWAVQSLTDAGGDYLLVVTLEASQYWTRQLNLKGDKAVDLGTGYQVRLPWLTSLETPVSVLQLTGALVDARGRIVRAGAEGLLARRTSLMPSSEGLQALLRDEDVLLLETLRREDLPHQPLVWQEALNQLIANLVRPAS